MIDINKQYTTRDGYPVRILATNIKNTDYPVAVAALHGDFEVVGNRTSDGKWSKDGSESPYDLIEVKPRIKRTVWVNVYDSWIEAFSTKDKAEEWAQDCPRIACVKVEIDVEHGHGLEGEA